MVNFDEKIEKLRAAIHQNCINLSRATDDQVKSAIMDNINNIWVEIHILKQRKSSNGGSDVSRMGRRIPPPPLLPLPPPPPPPPPSVHVS